MLHVPAWAALLLIGAALPVEAQEAPSVDCVASGMLIVLGAGSEAAGEGVRHWVSVSNPTMRTVQVRHRLAGNAGTTRVEQGRTLRLALGPGPAALAVPDILRNLTLLCRPG